MTRAPAIAVRLSKNGKIGPAATTYAAIGPTCPNSCALKRSGECYAQGGKVGMVNRQLDAAATGMSGVQVAHAEAAAIDALKPIPGVPMRLHTSGDCNCKTSARVVSAAAQRYQQRKGGTVWSYTHTWKKIDASDWHGVSILASVDDVRDAPIALARGYAPARYVATFTGTTAWIEQGIRWIPCQTQVQDTVCTACRLCFSAKALHARATGIAFVAHGMRARKLRTRLQEKP